MVATTYRHENFPQNLTFTVILVILDNGAKALKRKSVTRRGQGILQVLVVSLGLEINPF